MSDIKQDKDTERKWRDRERERDEWEDHGRVGDRERGFKMPGDSVR